MPSHCTIASITSRELKLSDGSPLLPIDIVVNELVDFHAKSALEAHRVPEPLWQELKLEATSVDHMALFVTHLAIEANCFGPDRIRDSPSAPPWLSSQALPTAPPV